MPVGFQNQSLAWIFSDKNIRFKGHGFGTINGNGQVRYEFINGTSNFAPIDPMPSQYGIYTAQFLKGFDFYGARCGKFPKSYKLIEELS